LPFKWFDIDIMGMFQWWVALFNNVNPLSMISMASFKDSIA
jgi:hypothetical protein